MSKRNITALKGNKKCCQKVKSSNKQFLEKDMKEKNKLDYAKDVIVSLFTGYIITFFGIVILAFLLLMFQISESTVDIGIIVIYVLACFLSGFVIGKRTKNRKFLWGMLSGGSYFCILLVISLLSRQSMENVGNDLITILLICIGSGTLGGMLS